MTLLTTHGLNKHYRVYDKPIDRLKELVLRRPCHRSHHVLKNIDLTVNSGEALGILGRNGAGKSTLLKTLLGVTLPDSGHIQSQGRITGLLELGSGFDQELSGWDNILTNGLLIGMSRADIETRREQIIDFSELSEAIHEPIKNYSSGMVMRLAFSIAIFAEPDCFIVDEALAVGDAAFQQKCYDKIRTFRQKGGALIFVSHDLNAIKMICDRVIVLESGRIQFDGDTETGVNLYNRLISKDSDSATTQTDNEAHQSFGTHQVVITQASLQREADGSPLFSAGDNVQLKLTLQANQATQDAVVGFMIKDRFGQDIYGTNSHHLNHSIHLNTHSLQTLVFDFPAWLAPGHYTLTLAVHAGIHHIDRCYYWRDNYLSFEIAGIRHHLFSGLCGLPTTIKTFHENSD
ncbi:MAG: ABC transporter ATP-binding protein [Hydrogenovibrio sp.]|uniref:ABC transporter ATP-binding protein n=1 Tax=Hydrogenovibrio sp. TaxID=2065821 RepID=UPI00287044C0|nr:ABC transporter ATP-binding protein [Hydrogenovibrio sp.]MDR9499703.1 ABC transporter ATP-binding protein [Hydrogenovibrio sp.]